MKLLIEDRYRIVATMDGDTCPVEEFLSTGEDSTAAMRSGLLTMLKHVAANGLASAPAPWIHEANKKEKIYEFRKGRLRIFFFKGEEGQIAVCTSGILKKGQKADLPSVTRASALRDEYLAARQLNTLEVICHEDE